MHYFEVPLPSKIWHLCIFHKIEWLFLRLQVLVCGSVLLLTQYCQIGSSGSWSISCGNSMYSILNTPGLSLRIHFMGSSTLNDILIWYRSPCWHLFLWKSFKILIMSLDPSSDIKINILIYLYIICFSTKKLQLPPARLLTHFCCCCCSSMLAFGILLSSFWGW